ncbi:MAG: PaaI family thioesterase [bacterium]|nr:PaaI family thioesterase [bacterium]MCY4194425.1 PaaI family thioesterase [bacterium]MCY4273053.1 PaaI family thioesterase [bacterium]
MLLAQLGIDWDPSSQPGHGKLRVFDEQCRGGQVRPSVLMLLADIAGGMIGERADPECWHFTTDFQLRTAAAPLPDHIDAVAEVLRAGAGTLACECRFSTPDGAEMGYAQIGFGRYRPRPGDPAKTAYDPPRPNLTGLADIDRPLAEVVGIEVADAAAGHVEVELAPQLLNPAGMMQGAMVALVGEVGAETLASHDLGAPHAVADMDIRYLLGGKIGPVYSTCRWMGDPTSGWVVAEIRDLGKGDRLMATMMLRVRPAR